MLVLLTFKSQNTGEFSFVKIILFIYFIPTIIALVRLYILRFKFFSVLLINLFFGWTVYGWWLAFAKAFSSKNVIYIKNKSKNTVVLDKYDQLNKLNNLRASGAINEEEFEVEKQKILSH
ncbi:superinfection immunity protein [Chryseobacterium arthrosphaerae]|uniref:SHOCT domain-containing protein n=1 Tax=Chryseobacterium arthrosphaerae TaxID=651561 RepID=UPI001E2FD5B8|nr:SHOCT domain-containing protein [Chryseobacterium arthrosphaerae]UEQ75255.1 superinfection immunity protein [Chryseobacterium arthrosphaerae]